MAKGEQRQNVLAQVLSDLDAFGREGMTGNINSISLKE